MTEEKAEKIMTSKIISPRLFMEEYFEKINSTFSFRFSNYKRRKNHDRSFGGIYGGRDGTKNWNDAFHFTTSYSYRIKINEHQLSPGISFNYLRHKFNLVSSGLWPEFDPLIYPSEEFKYNSIFADVGLWYQFRKLVVGFATDYLLFKELTEDLNEVAKRLTFTAEYTHVINDKVSLKPVSLFQFQIHEGEFGSKDLLLGLITTFENKISLGFLYNPIFIKHEKRYVSHYVSPYIGFTIKDVVNFSFSLDFYIDSKDIFDEAGEYPIFFQSNLRSEFASANE